jgi:hypothetical protein
MTAADTSVPACARRRQGVEQVVDTGNVVRDDFRECRRTEHRQRGRSSEPREAVVQREIPGIRRSAHDEHRHEHPKAGCGCQPDAEDN